MTTFNEQIRQFLQDDDLIACLSNLSAFLKQHDALLNWAGFYFVKNNQLVLGPFQGKPACARISFQNGVCGKCYRTKSTQRIDEVLKFPGHIACDSDSRSELCVPVIVNGNCIMEIDLDSAVPFHFTSSDQEQMEQAAKDLADAFLNHHWIIE